MGVNIVSMNLEAKSLKKAPMNKKIATLDQVNIKDTKKDALSNDDDH